MIYKISLSESSYIPYIEMSKLGDFLVVDKFAVLSTEFDKKYIISYLNKSINDGDQILISEIDKNNIKFLPYGISKWVEAKGLEEDLIKYEKEKQEIIKGTLDFIKELDRKWGDELNDERKKNEQCK